MKEHLKPLLHYLIHISLIYAMIRFFAQDYFSILSIIMGSLVITFDSLPTAKKIGIRKYLYLRSVMEDWKYRKYFLHTPTVLVISLTLSLLSLSPLSFYFGLFFLSIALNLIADLVQMKFVHKISIRSWLLD
jgi:ABC-type phosphate transport system permease subunit